MECSNENSHVPILLRLQPAVCHRLHTIQYSLLCFKILTSVPTLVIKDPLGINTLRIIPQYSKVGTQLYMKWLSEQPSSGHIDVGLQNINKPTQNNTTKRSSIIHSVCECNTLQSWSDDHIEKDRLMLLCVSWVLLPLCLSVSLSLQIMPV